MLRRVVLVAGFFAAVAAAAARGQGAWVEKKSLTLDGARRAIGGAMAEARKRGTTGVFAVVDDGGNLMAVERIDGTFAAGASISIGKARTSALFKKPTKVFEDIINKGRTAMTTVDFTPLQGGVPIVVDGAIAGAIGVSGAASAQEDEELAVAGAAAVNALPGKVAYYNQRQVSDAFAKGAVLFDQGERYMVHASRRESAGQAEVHAKDADIIYVLDGTATFVTGGSLLDTEDDRARRDPRPCHCCGIRGDAAAEEGRRGDRARRNPALVRGGCRRSSRTTSSRCVDVRAPTGILTAAAFLLGAAASFSLPAPQDPPTGTPEAVIDLATAEGLAQVQGAVAVFRHPHRRDGVSGTRHRRPARRAEGHDVRLHAACGRRGFRRFAVGNDRALDSVVAPRPAVGSVSTGTASRSRFPARIGAFATAGSTVVLRDATLDD